MKITVLSFVFAMTILATQGFTVRPGTGRPGRPSFPSFPGQGPFNPRPTFPKPYQFPRFRRDEGQVTESQLQSLQVEPEHQAPAALVNFHHKVFDGRLGSQIVTDRVAESSIRLGTWTDPKPTKSDPVEF